MNIRRSYTLIRRALFALIILVLHLFQFTVIPLTGLSFPVLLLLPMGVAVAMAEKEFPAVFYGILIGVLWDSASPVTDGLWAFVFPVMLCIAGLLTHYTLRNTLLTALIFTLTGTVIYLAAVSLYDTGSFSFEIMGDIIKQQWIPVIITSLIICIPEYFLTKKIAKTFHHDKVSY